MTTYVVTESPEDAELLERVLRHGATEAEFFVVPAGGKANASSLARSLLAGRSDPVVLVVDADTRDPDMVAQQRTDLEAALGLVAPPDSYRLIVMVPALEALLLRDDVWDATGRAPLSELDQQLARYAPREVLDRVLGGASRAELIRSLPDECLDLLARAAELGPIFELLSRRAA